MAMTVRALQLLAGMIGRRRNVSVIFDPAAHTAYTDGKRLVLPVVSTLGTDEHGILVEGLLDHECAHLRFTRFEALARLKTEPPITARITNILEDVWIEREQKKILPGSYRNIVASMNVMIGMGWYGSTGASTQAVPHLFLNWLLHHMLGRHYKDDRIRQYGADYLAVIAQYLDHALLDRVAGIATQVDSVVTTDGAIDLACEIVRILGITAKKDVDRGAASPLPALLSASETDLPATDRGQAIVTLLQQQGVMSKGGAGTDPSFSATEGEGSMIEPVEAAGHSLESENSAARAAAGPVEQSLGMRLESLLEARTMSAVTFGRSGGRLDGRRLAGIKLGNLDIFRQEDVGVEISTAVAILLDTSLSMKKEMGGLTRSAAASAIAIAAGRVLDRHYVPFTLHGFGSGVTQFKGFADPWAPTERYCLVARTGATMLEFGLQRIADPLLGRTESRRLALVVSDGRPDNEELSLVMIQELSRVGVEFAFIFVGGDGKDFEAKLRREGYSITRVHDFNGLANAIFEAIRSAI